MQFKPADSVHELNAKKDPQTVTPEGKRVDKLIDGVVLREATTHLDERGELCEIYNPAWNLSDDAIVYVYQASVRPGKLKGWIYHAKQYDRLFVSAGVLKWVLYDLRPDSPTKHMFNEIYLSDRRRGLLIIPPYVAHAVQNVGTSEAFSSTCPRGPTITPIPTNTASLSIPVKSPTPSTPDRGGSAVFDRLPPPSRVCRLTCSRTPAYRLDSRQSCRRHPAQGRDHTGRYAGFPR
jgi:dTDP-4-dehydrorhamnose 3,5-epimerase